MKTHELSKVLTQLSLLLKSMPNMDLNDLNPSYFEHKFRIKDSDLKIGLSTLVSLSSVDKQQWIGLIKEFSFPIEIRQRDASRDILGKLLRYLEANAGARRALTDNVRRKSTAASPELMKALSILIGGEKS